MPATPAFGRLFEASLGTLPAAPSTLEQQDMLALPPSEQRDDSSDHSALQEECFRPQVRQEDREGFHSKC